MYKKVTSPTKLAENAAMADITESSSSDGSPASIVPSGDVTLDKDVDNKTLKQNLYDLKLRIYYMEQKNKYLEDNDGGDIYQKYVDLQTEFEKLKKNLDEKDDLLLKAQKVTLYLRQEKERTLYEFQEKEKLYAETIQQLEKEVEEMKLRDPKFGLHSTTAFMSGGDSAESSLCVSALNKAQHKRIGELESQLSQLNMELESVKANNDQLEQAVLALQRKINLSNKEITELNKELDSLHKERDLYVENCSKRDEILDKMEKQKLEITEKLSKVQLENESLRSALTCNIEQNTPLKNDKGTAVIVQRLLIENKKVNGRLRKVKEDLLHFYEQCSACPHCVNEKKMKKTPTLNLRSPTAASAAALDGASEDDDYEKGDGGGASESENDGECEKYANLGENELKAMLREKDELVQQLENELKKRTFNLQELVNKELWDKNREIEKLNKLSEKRKRENDLLRKQSTCGGGDSRVVVVGSASCNGYGSAMRELQPCLLRNYKIDEKENISSTSDDVKLLKEQLRGCLEEKKALLDKITRLESKVAVSDEERRSQNSLVRNLRLECAKRKGDFEEAEKARKEAFGACALLTCRLEELAYFLESLLAHDVTGINAKKRQLLKQAIEKSREISKSFSCAYSYAAVAAAALTTTTLKSECSSVDLSVPILPDCSEINLSFSGDDDDGDDDEYDMAAVRDRLRDATWSMTDGDLADSDQPRKGSTTKRYDFASTEDSDNGGAVVKKSISFVRRLSAGDELVFSGAVVRTLANERNDGDDNSPKATTARLAPDLGGVDANEMQNSVTASSAIVSLDEAPPKIGDFDSESETWSEPDRNVSAARIGLTNSASKVYGRRPPRSEQQLLLLQQQAQRYNSDSDASSSNRLVAARKYADASAADTSIRQMQKRILHLEKINESLRDELDCLRSLPSPLHSRDPSTAAAADKKTDMEKLSEKTKLRNLLNKINLENCVDTSKYRDAVELTRKQLRELSKHLAKTNKLDKFVSLKLKEVCEHFDLSELCCSRLHRRLEEVKTRNDVLAELLQETQSKFEQVMTELRATKLAYNGVVLEHEQNIFKYKRCELDNEQLKERLESADELCRALQEEAAAAKKDEDDDDGSLKGRLEKAFERIAQLERLVATSGGGDAAAGDELVRCKRELEKLGEANERLLGDVEQLDTYKAQIEEYETQLRRYRDNCDRLERELFEKDGVEKLCEQQRARLAEQRLETDAVSRALESASGELAEARRQVDRLRNEVERLTDELRDARGDRQRQIAELKATAERQLADKADEVAQLRRLLEISDHRTRKFENELRLLRDMLDTCEREKQEFRANIARQADQHENLKKQHQQQMKHLLSQIIAHRTEEESSLLAHRELVRQIEQAQNKKQLWKNSIREWKDKYEELKKEKQDVENRLLGCDAAAAAAASVTNREPDHRQQQQQQQSTTSLVDQEAVEYAVERSSANSDVQVDNVADFKLMKFNMERDWLAREAELRYQVDVATLTTSHVILEWTRLANEKLRLQRELHRRDKPFYVHHLENVKCQLETRLKELETANEDLELRLKEFQSSKVTPSDFNLDMPAPTPLQPQPQQQDAAVTSRQPYEESASGSFSYLTRSPLVATATLSSASTLRNETGYTSPSSSSLPTSPNRRSPVAATLHGCLFACENYVDDDTDADANMGMYDNALRTKVTPTRKHCGVGADGGEINATSPDLGIDSDHGRNSSSFEFDSGNGGETKIRYEIINLEEENKSLKRELGQTKKELEETLGKLTTLNRNKKRMEKAIFQQIFETKHILKRARVNLEDGDADADADAANTVSQTET